MAKMTHGEVRDLIIEQMRQIARQEDVALETDFNTDDELLAMGLDSMAFAVLVVQLEDRLGYDPFLIMSEPVYPTTFGEFVDIYFEHQPE